jgi:hypothetical protein
MYCTHDSPQTRLSFGDSSKVSILAFDECACSSYVGDEDYRRCLGHVETNSNQPSGDNQPPTMKNEIAADCGGKAVQLLQPSEEGDE